MSYQLYIAFIITDRTYYVFTAAFYSQYYKTFVWLHALNYILWYYIRMQLTNQDIFQRKSNRWRNICCNIWLKSMFSRKLCILTYYKDCILNSYKKYFCHVLKNICEILYMIRSMLLLTFTRIYVPSYRQIYFDEYQNNSWQIRICGVYCMQSDLIFVKTVLQICINIGTV